MTGSLLLKDTFFDVTLLNVNAEKQSTIKASYILIRILLYLPGAKGQLSISPSGIVDVTESSRFTIACSYIGQSTYSLVTWFKNGANKHQRFASNCDPFSGNADQSIEFTCTNNGKDFTLTFKEVKKDQDGERWSCGVNNPAIDDSAEVTIKIKGR